MCWNTARRRRSDCSVGRSASMSSFTSVATGPLAPHAGRADAAAACATDRAAFVASFRPSHASKRGAHLVRSCRARSSPRQRRIRALPPHPLPLETRRPSTCPARRPRGVPLPRRRPCLPPGRARVRRDPESPLQAGKTTVFPRATPSRSLPAGWCASARLPLSCPLPTGTRRLSRRDRATAAATLTPRAATRVHLAQPGWSLAGAITPGFVLRRSWKFSPVNV